MYLGAPNFLLRSCSCKHVFNKVLKDYFQQQTRHNFADAMPLMFHCKDFKQKAKLHK